MTRPAMRYLVSSPGGDVPLDQNRLDFPLEADPLKTPYRVYFDAITGFLTRENFRPLLQSINKFLNADPGVTEIKEIIVRTEKHGALYHPASVECIAGDKKAKFALNVAVTATGRNALIKEYDALRALHMKFKLSHLPRAFCLDEMHSMVFLLEEWFEDHHEFHIAKTESGNEQIKLWEYGKGDRFLSDEQSFEIYKQIAMILTSYYDVETYRMIFPWHHAAGDFVVCVGGGDSTNNLDTKLTTARAYEPFIGSDNDTIHPVLALFYFLLHLSLQMRLDRLDGVGDIVWADEKCLDATITGFLAGLGSRKDFRNLFCSTDEFLTLLRSFSVDDFAATIGPVAEQYEKTKDYPVIKRNLGEHIARLFFILQNYP
jgi:hypothetical protein